MIDDLRVEAQPWRQGRVHSPLSRITAPDPDRDRLAVAVGVPRARGGNIVDAARRETEEMFRPAHAVRSDIRVLEHAPVDGDVEGAQAASPVERRGAQSGCQSGGGARRGRGVGPPAAPAAWTAGRAS